MGETNVKGPNHWGDNETWVYTGQFFDADGIFTFAENIDDDVYVAIDGVPVLQNGNYNTVTTTSQKAGSRDDGTLDEFANGRTPNTTSSFGMGTENNGWHNFEVRFRNGGGGAGTFSGQGWGGNDGENNAANLAFLNKGFGLNVNGTTSYNGADYVIPADPGDGSLFRVANIGGGTVLVDAGATIAAGSTNNATSITLRGFDNIDTAVFRLNSMASATSSTADNLTIAGVSPDSTSAHGTVEIGANGTLTVGRVQFSAGAVLEKTGSGTLVVSGSINGTGAVTTRFTNSTLNVSAGRLIFNSNSAIEAQSTGLVTAQGTGTVGGTGTLPALQANSGGTVAPGVDGAGTLKVMGALTMAEGSKLAIEIGTLASSDALKVSGTVDVQGATLQLAALPQFNMTAGDLFFILLNDGPGAINGIFSGIADNSTITFGEAQFRARYTADSGANSAIGGNDFALEALNTIPEPSALLSLLGGLGTLVGLRRFRPRAR
jgi:hypothetical protein